MMKIHSILLISLLSFAIVSCGGAAAAPTDSPDQPEPTSNLVEEPLQLEETLEPGEMTSTPPSAEKFVNLTKKDLAGRLKIETDKIVLIEAKEIIWPDASLGCPSPGMMYAQGQVPGFRIELGVDETKYIYHTDFNGQVILCLEQDPDNPDPLSPDSATPNIGVPLD